MSNSNKSYRVRTNVGSDTMVNVNINQDYDILEILSLKISTENIYKLHTSNYGCVVGRVLANGGVGVQNAKISLFIEANEGTLEDEVLSFLYPYNSTNDKNNDGIRYNLLPDEQINECHQQIGTFPNKRLVLDDNNVLEIFDTYYKYTTTTNSAGDYMLFGVPVGEQTIHMDVDLSDIGILSQKPIDFYYKGYDKTQFESSARFKKDTNLNSLTQVISQNKSINVYPFWGDNSEGTVKITRNDIDIDYKFEPTCVFIGSIVSDNKDNGFSHKCEPSVAMGKMSELTTGSGTIEMIRKKTDGTVEECFIQGNELIDGDGTWCYQIPMNLDYITTDEYGNLVPTDNPEKGIPTRTRVRFRVSLSDHESDHESNHLTKLLVPNNPKTEDELDYVFGTKTVDKEDGSGSFRDLLWNNVYTVKSYIPRIQKGNHQKTEKFSGFKYVNMHGKNNPIPYNNMRVNFTYKFILECAIIKNLIKVARWINSKLGKNPCVTVGDGLCPDLEGWYFAPGCRDGHLTNTLNDIKNGGEIDEKSIEAQNSDNENICVTNNTDYFLQCVEVNLAMENETIQFDFYNDWINGLLYIPRWMVNISKKKSYLFGLIRTKSRMYACDEDSFKDTRRLTQQCSLLYKNEEGSYMYNKVASKLGCKNDKRMKCHETKGRNFTDIFGKSGGLIHNAVNSKGQSVYYPRPAQWLSNDKKCLLFATDIVLLGNLNTCNKHGIPVIIDEMLSSTYKLPPNVAQSNMNSDGALYGIAGSSLCSNGTTTQGAEEKKQTFEDYISWSRDKEFYETDPEDIDEYAVTEVSGIDWGLYGPGQKELKENFDKSRKETRLFRPGGHFLGISCKYPEVNIKSCVNLSRMCEFGVIPSQRQYRVVHKKENGELIPSYAFILPTGFISKNEINNSSFRSIFATLNHNSLKTNVDENGLRYYDFKSLNPINFDGSLSDFIGVDKDTPYNTITNDNPNTSITNAFTRTYESVSEDYYRFRLGIHNEQDKKDIKKKYLVERNGLLAMPVFENSYYFYFGLSDGKTSLDRFFTDFYASCFNENKKEINVSIKENNNKVICNNISTVKFLVENVPFPYSYELFPSDEETSIGENVLNTKNDEYYEKEITIEGLEPGSYFLNVKNNFYAISIDTKFNIKEGLPSDEEKILSKENATIEAIDFEESPSFSYIEDKNTKKYNVNVYCKSNESNKKINFKFKNGKNDNPFLVGFMILQGDYFLTYFIDDAKNKDEHTSFVKKLGFNNGKEFDAKNMVEISKTDEETIYKVKAWDEPFKPSCYYIYNCGDADGGYENYKIIRTEDIEVKALTEKFSVWLADESITLRDLLNEGIINQTNYTTRTINVNKLSNSYNGLKVKKNIVYNKSIFTPGATHSCLIGYNGGINTVENVEGYGETSPNGCTNISNNPYQSISEAEKAGYIIDLNEIRVPTSQWTKNSLKEEIGYRNPYMYIETVKKTPYKYGATGTTNDNKTVYDEVISDDTLSIDVLYRPFYFNSIILFAPKNIFNVLDYKVDEDYDKRFPKQPNNDNGDSMFLPYPINGAYSHSKNSGNTECYAIMNYAVANGRTKSTIDKDGKTIYSIGDIEYNMTIESDGIIKDGDKEIEARVTNEYKMEKKDSARYVDETNNNYDIRNNYVNNTDDDKFRDKHFDRLYSIYDRGFFSGSHSALTLSNKSVNDGLVVYGDKKYAKALNPTTFNLKNADIRCYFKVNEHPIGNDDSDYTSEVYTGIRFYDDIWINKNRTTPTGETVVDGYGRTQDLYIDDKGHYKTVGTSSNGVRYFFINYEDFRSLMTSIANINTIFGADDYIYARVPINDIVYLSQQQPVEYRSSINGWQSIHTIDYNGKGRLKDNEITQNLVDATLYNYKKVETLDEKGVIVYVPDEINNGLNPHHGDNGRLLVIGMYDEITSLPGSPYEESDYKEEYHYMGKVVPKHTNRLTVMRIYRVLDQGGDYSYENGWINNMWIRNNS